MTVRGYTRPLIEDDDASEDIAALQALGVDQVIIETTHRTFPARDGLLDELSTGDELVVTSLERLDRRLDDLITTLRRISEQGVALRCPDMAEVESSSDTAGALFTVLAAYSEHPLTRAAQKQRPTKTGRQGGRPPVLDATKIAMVLELRAAGRSIPHISRVLGISQTTVHRTIHRGHNDA